MLYADKSFDKHEVVKHIEGICDDPQISILSMSGDALAKKALEAKHFRNKRPAIDILLQADREVERAASRHAAWSNAGRFCQKWR